jgi:hypothetical protein
MAGMQPPPPRYRIVERDGRLIATDTWAEKRPTRPEAPMTSMPGTPKPVRPSTPASPLWVRDGGMISALGAVLVLSLCAGTTDEAGNPTLTTANFYDIKGPRRIMLDPASAKRLGRVLLALLSALLAMLLLACITAWGFIALFVLVGMTAGSVNTTARPAITRWLDRLEQAG